MPLSRRRMLKGLGASIALPFLNAMVPSGLVAAAAPKRPPRRAAFLFMPNGVHPDKWTPTGTGRDFALSPILEPLAPHRNDLLVLTELMNQHAATGEDGHYTKTANFLTTMRIQKTTGANINSGGASVDQVMARHVGGQTLFPSLVYGVDRITTGVDKNVGFTRLYGSAISWTSATQPCAKEIDPRLAFDRLFRGVVPGKPAPEESPWKQSVLDAVLDDAKSLQRDLGIEDQNKLAEYLEAIRSVERRIEDREKVSRFEANLAPEIRQEAVALDQRIDDYVSYHAGLDVTDKTRLMLDLIVLAFWSDASRIATFMFGNSVSGRNFSFLPGVHGGHHAISHHKDDPRQLAQYEIINRWHLEQIAYLLSRMKAIPEGDGTLLDHAMVLFGSGLRDGNRHSPRNLPIVVAGRGSGALRPGQHLVYEQNTPLANLYLTMLHAMDVPAEHFGDSTGTLGGVAA